MRNGVMVAYGANQERSAQHQFGKVKEAGNGHKVQGLQGFQSGMQVMGYIRTVKTEERRIRCRRKTNPASTAKDKTESVHNG